MRVADLSSGPLTTLESDMSLAEAAAEMEDNGVTAVAIFDGTVLVGMFTDRDLIRAAADGVALDRTTLEEYMTGSPVTLPQHAAASEALRIMLDEGLGHLPVVDDDGEPVAILTVADVARGLLAGKLGAGDGR